MRMIVVDDSKTMRTYMVALAEELHFETKQAVDGREALEVLGRNAPYDVALVDWDMPRMNGLELVQAIRHQPAFDGMKVMMVTTQTAMEKIAGALNSGADDFLMKPVSKEALEEKLRLLGLIA